MTKEDVFDQLMKNQTIDLMGKLNVAYKIGYDSGVVAGEQKSLCSSCSLKEIYDRIEQLELYNRADKLKGDEK